MNLFELYATLTLDTSDYERGVGNVNTFSSKLENVFSAVTKAGTLVTAAISAVGTAVAVLGVEAAADAKALESQFSQSFGDMANDAENAVGRVADASGIIDTRLKEAASSIYSFARASGGDATTSMSLMETALQAAADSAAYYDTTIEEATATLQSFLKGNYENDAALGLSATETTRNAAAMELFGAKFNELSEIQKQETLLKMVTDAQALSGAMGQAAREADGWANVTGNLQQAWTDFKAEFGKPLLDVVTPVFQNITAAIQNVTASIDWAAWGSTVSNAVAAGVDGFTSLVTTIEEITPVVAVATSAFVSLKAGMAIQSVVQGFQSAQVAISLLSLEVGKANLAQAALNGTMTVGQTIVALLTGQMSMASLAQAAMAKGQAALNAVMNANPIALIVTGIGLLIGTITTLWATNEDFRNGVIEIWGSIKDFFSNTWNAITGFFSKAWTAITAIWNGSVAQGYFSQVWESIKGVFNVVESVLSGDFQGAWDAIKGIVDGWSGYFSDIWEEIKGVFADALNIFSGIGTNIVDGLKQGISGAWESLTGWVGQKFDGLVSSINRRMEIASPSKVFARIGGFMAEGVGVGWESEWSAVQSGIQNSMEFETATVGVSVGDRQVQALNGLANVMLSANNNVGDVPAIINLVTPDGDTFATWQLPSLIRVADAAGIPIVSAV